MKYIWMHDHVLCKHLHLMDEIVGGLRSLNVRCRVSTLCEWETAMQDEMISLLASNTWEGIDRAS